MELSIIFFFLNLPFIYQLFILQSFGDRLLLCGEIDPNLVKTEDMGGQLRDKSAGARERLLLSGDVEPNPGPPRR